MFMILEGEIEVTFRGQNSVSCWRGGEHPGQRTALFW